MYTLFIIQLSTKFETTVLLLQCDKKVKWYQEVPKKKADKDKDVLLDSSFIDHIKAHNLVLLSVAPFSMSSWLFVLLQ